MLLDVLDAVILNHGVLIALMCDDWQWHAMHWAVRGADEHRGLVVFTVTPADVTVPLDQCVCAKALRDDTVEEKLRRLAQTQDTHVVVGMGHLRNHETYPHKGPLPIYKAALARVAHDTRRFTYQAFAHVLLLVRLTDLYYRRCHMTQWFLQILGK